MNRKEMRCIGHRGARGHAPENTLASFQKALDLGATWVELDVYHVDGRLMVFHDERLERTTNGEGRLQEQDFNYLRSLDAGNGEKIPTLTEVFELIGMRAGVNIELKGAGTARPVVRFISALRAKGRHDHQLLVSSFQRRELSEVQKRDSRIRLGIMIKGKPRDDIEFALGLGAYSVHPSRAHVNRAFVQDAHRSGLKVFVFTVNHSHDIRKMQALGVDGVFTDYPDRVLGVL